MLEDSRKLNIARLKDKFNLRILSDNEQSAKNGTSLYVVSLGSVGCTTAEAVLRS